MINRPQPDEYPAFAATYINKVPSGADVLQLLADSQASTYDLFSHMDETRAVYAYAPGKWTLKQVLGHMIDVERVFAFRVLCFSRTFTELPGFDQDIFIQNATYGQQSIQTLANEFRDTRQANLYLFKTLTEEQQLKRGVASDNTVTARALVYMAAGHELHHLQLISERY